MKVKHSHKPFYSTKAELKLNNKMQVESLEPTNRLAIDDRHFLLREELRPVRLQLELLKPELMLQDEHIDSTAVIFGSARIPEPAVAKDKLNKLQALLAKDPHDTELQKQVKIAERLFAKTKYYTEARRLAALISENCQNGTKNFVVVTGGGPGIMEAANRGAHDVHAKSIGLNITLPMEQAPNPYISPELCFQFHYFAIRKMHFLIRARVLIAFPGGFGTLDELFEALTLLQTRKIEPVPVILFGAEFWNQVVNFQALVDEGVISENDLELFQFVETAEEAWHIISRFYNLAATDVA